MSKTKWNNTDKKINELYLDLENPRVPEYARGDEESIFKYLLEEENVIGLAENIAVYGYHYSAVSIVYKEGDKYIVLDGNRRLAACKLLFKPSLAKGKYKRKLDNIAKDFKKKGLKDIKVTIAPSRDSAEKEISDIHLNILMKPWEKIQKLRKYHDLIKRSSYNIKDIARDYGKTEKSMPQELAKLAFYEKILPLLDSRKDQEKLLKSGINKIERVLIPSYGQLFLGYEIDEKTGSINIKDTKIFIKRLKKIIPDLLDNKHLRAACVKDEIENRFKAIIPSYTTKDSKADKKKKKEDKKITSKIVKKIKDKSPFPVFKKLEKVYPNDDALDIIQYICRGFGDFCEQLEQKHHKKQGTPFKAKNEYDIQYLLYAVLRLFFLNVTDLRREEKMPSYGSGSSIIDFLLSDNEIGIEVKYTYSKTKDKELKKQLILDKDEYSTHPKCKILVFFIYDRGHNLINYKGIEKDLSEKNKVFIITAR